MNRRIVGDGNLMDALRAASKEVRVLYKQSRAQVCEELSFGKDAYERWENGRGHLSGENLNELFEYLNIGVVIYLKLNEDETKS